MQSNGADDPARALRQYARVVSYFSLTDALMDKRKGLFVRIIAV